MHVDYRVWTQFERIASSIARLTKGTTLEPVIVLEKLLTDDTRVGFTVASPKSVPPFQCHTGILLDGIENWTDEMLDQRMYASADASVRHLLNSPSGIEEEFTSEQKIPMAFAITRANSGKARHSAQCAECKSLWQKIETLLAELSTTTQQGTRYCRTYSQSSRHQYLRSLQRFLKISDEIASTRAELSAHLQGGKPTAPSSQ